MGDRIMTEVADREADIDRAVEPLMTLTEAAAAIGRAPESVRTMIRRGKLTATKGNDGRWLVLTRISHMDWRLAGAVHRFLVKDQPLTLN
jgi:hypothetical protein